MRPEDLNLRPKKLNLRPERPGLRPERPVLRPERLDLRPERLEKHQRGGRTYYQMDVMVHPCVLQDIGPLGPLPKINNSSKDRTWSAVPDALLGVIS